MKKIIVSFIAIIISTSLHAMLSELGTQARQAGRYIPRGPVVRPSFPMRSSISGQNIRIPRYQVPGYRELGTLSQASATRELVPVNIARDVNAVINGPQLTDKEKLEIIKQMLMDYGTNAFEKVSTESLQDVYIFLQETEPNGWAAQIISNILRKKEGVKSVLTAEPAKKGIFSRYGKGLAAALGTGAALEYLRRKSTGEKEIVDIDVLMEDYPEKIQELVNEFQNIDEIMFLASLSPDDQIRYIETYLLEGKNLAIQRNIKIYSFEDLQKLANEAQQKRFELWNNIITYHDPVYGYAGRTKELQQSLKAIDYETKWALSGQPVQLFVENLYPLFPLASTGRMPTKEELSLIDQLYKSQLQYPFSITNLIKKYRNSFK